MVRNLCRGGGVAVLTCGPRLQLDRGQLADGDQLEKAAIRPAQVLQGLHFLASGGRRRRRRDRKHQHLRALEREGDGGGHCAT